MLAQLVERFNGIEEVRSSILLHSTIGKRNHFEIKNQSNCHFQGVEVTIFYYLGREIEEKMRYGVMDLGPLYYHFVLAIVDNFFREMH